MPDVSYSSEKVIETYSEQKVHCVEKQSNASYPYIANNLLSNRIASMTKANQTSYPDAGISDSRKHAHCLKSLLECRFRDGLLQPSFSSYSYLSFNLEFEVILMGTML